MISERQLAKGFRELWDEVLPMLTPHFIRVFNEAYRRDIGDDASAVPSGRDTDPTVVAEFGFHVARLVHERGESFDNVAHNDALLFDAERIALSLIASYEKQKCIPPSAIPQEARSEGLLLVRNYRVFLAKHQPDDIEFSPSIQGSGFIDSCNADISVGKTLLEVKTVERNIASKDFRQLLVYLALQYATGDRRWSCAGFLNPRRGLVYEFSVDKIVPIISGGRLVSDVFQEMVQFFGTRNNQVDSTF
jgi:hypothetical protein